MAYRDDILALGPSHIFTFDNNFNDLIGATPATGTGTIFSTTPICEDSSFSILTNGVNDRVNFPETNEINLNTPNRKSVSFWCRFDSIQPPPKALYIDGGETSSFKFVMAFGNNIMFECANTSFTVQVYGPVLEPNRTYHITGVFLGSSNGNIVKLYVDGVRYENSEPANAQPNDVLATGRAPAFIGLPTGTVEVGNQTILLNTPNQGNYAFVSMWGDISTADLTDQQIRDILFERGAKPEIIISTDSEVNMNTFLSLNNSTTLPNAALNVRVEDVIGSGDLTLTSDNIIFNELSGIHVQWMGTGKLTWINGGNSNASIASTPNGGTVEFAKNVPITINTLDASTFQPIQDTVVRVTAANGGSRPVGDVLLFGNTDVSGQISGNFLRTINQPINVRARKGSNSPYYISSEATATLTSEGAIINFFMVRDE